VLGRAIETYENRDEELVAFEQGALEQPADLARRFRFDPGQFF